MTTSWRRRILGLYALLGVANLAVWLAALSLFRHNPVLLGAAVLAYGFGLRHAIDADHIAAIDNATRVILQSGRRPITVGLFFALGHSTVVILASAAVAAAAGVIAAAWAPYRTVASMIGTSVSSLFLFAIAAANFMILRQIWGCIRKLRQGDTDPGHDMDLMLDGRGLLARLFRPMVRLVSTSWHLFPVGFLFGLGFDTAGEIAVLGISASGAGHAIPVWSIMVFPALFTAGMSLADTTDGIMMVGAYAWALGNPIRKLYYNLAITSVSVVVAAAVGSVECLGAIDAYCDLRGSFWIVIGFLNDRFWLLGGGIIAIFAIVYGVSVIIGRYRDLRTA